MISSLSPLVASLVLLTAPAAALAVDPFSAPLPALGSTFPAVTDNVRAFDSWTALHHASFAGNNNDVQGLIARGDAVDARDEDQTTALMYAAWMGHTAVCETLLQARADINARDNRGHSAVTWAIKGGYRDTLQYLVSRGADVQQEDKRGNTPVFLAVYWNNAEAVRILVSSARLNINTANKFGLTPLMTAVRQGNMAVAQALLSLGANSAAMDQQGRAAVWFAVAYGHRDILTLLLPGANVEQRDKTGLTLLHTAARYGNLFALNTLIEHGANVNALTEHGNSALMLAAARGCIDCVRALGAHGAALDVRNHYGDTALHVAVNTGSPGLVGMLINAGVPVKTRNKHGDTAASMASRMHKNEIARLFARD